MMNDHWLLIRYTVMNVSRLATGRLSMIDTPT